jgi:mono/diheme cytochrome c family protein
MTATAADLPPASTKAGVTYTADIKPIFEKTCFKCHGAEKQKGKLRLDSYEAAMKGGENAPNIKKGDSAKSPLVLAVAHIGSEDDFMPPPDKGKQLSNDAIGLIRAWIDQGAKK